MRDEGHEMGNHLLGDFPSILLSAGRFDRELRENHRLLARYGPVKWFRPASGWFSRRMLRGAEEIGYRCCLGSVYPRDGHLPFIWLTTSYVLRKVFPGSIIILHDGRNRHRRTVEVLRRVLPELKRRGYRLVTVSEVVDVKNSG
jgi:peptidoglycan/xylan/chitin deacetylase (PgdA/CDA1 family)